MGLNVSFSTTSVHCLKEAQYQACNCSRDLMSSPGGRICGTRWLSTLEERKYTRSVDGNAVRAIATCSYRSFSATMILSNNSAWRLSQKAWRSLSEVCFS